jgi:hypothetical protein
MRVIAQDTEMQDENFKADISSNLTQDKRKEIYSIIAYTCDFGHISSRVSVLIECQRNFLACLWFQ